MITFVVLATLLTAVVAALLLPPLWLGRRPAASTADRQAANLAIFRDQLAELEREKAEGTLADADFEQAKRELQHRLLQEAQPEAGTAAYAPSRNVALALIVLLPALALGGYGLLGNPKGLNPTQPRPEPAQQVTQEQIEGMVAKLAEKLKANPDDMQNWLMLARSYKVLGRYAEAANAYGKAEKVVVQNAELLADYAEALGMSASNGPSLRGKPQQLINQALKLDPQNPHALLLAGGAAKEAGDPNAAADYWEKLLPMTEPGSKNEAMLKEEIRRIRQGNKPAAK